MDVFSIIVISIIVVVVVFSAIRELLCWYWKINENLALLKEVSASLKNIESLLKQNQKTSRSAHPPKEGT